MNALYGGELWDADKRQIDGVINDAAGKKAMDVLVNQMVPLTPKGSNNWFIDEVNAAISQGKVCVGFQWIAAMGGLLDPKSSQLGNTKEKILDKLAFAPLPKQETEQGAARRHGAPRLAVHPGGEAGRGAELHQVVPDARGPEEVGAARRRPGAQRRPPSPEFLEAQPYNKVFTESVPRLKDFWNLPEYAKLLNVHSTAGQRGDLRHAEAPDAALDKLASEEQEAFSTRVAASRGPEPSAGWGRPGLLTIL